MQSAAMKFAILPSKESRAASTCTISISFVTMDSNSRSLIYIFYWFVRILVGLVLPVFFVIEHFRRKCHRHLVLYLLNTTLITKHCLFDGSFHSRLPKIGEILFGPVIRAGFRGINSKERWPFWFVWSRSIRCEHSKNDLLLQLTGLVYFGMAGSEIAPSVRQRLLFIEFKSL